MIDVIGIGLDGPAGLSRQCQEMITQATLLVGAGRLLDFFPEHPAPRLPLGDLQGLWAELQPQLTPEARIVILASGDPLYFGLGRLLLTYFSPEQLRFHPHLSSVQLAFNRLKLPWQDAVVLSVHGRALDCLVPPLQQGVAKLAILTDPQHHPVAIARLYRSLDLANAYQFWLCENLGAETERITAYSLADLEQLDPATIAPLNVLVLVRCEAAPLPDLVTLPRLGLPDSTFLSFPDRPGLMTKREIRLLALGELALQPRQIIWDIGAGTGAMAIEMARLCPESQVYAIEKTAAGLALIEQNCRRLQVRNVVPVRGVAPAALTNLPRPDRVFIGGSGGQLETILNYLQACLTPEARVVLALATLENLSLGLQWFQRQGWPYSVQQVQIARSLALAQLTRFQPLNPVYLLLAQPPKASGSTDSSE
ncbi:precorrin-6y C5,15-methyltransferase (decarboxylating) subunit CbiE [Synechocystis sp. LKSZ1]|uniref:precorrin-6y C5,15-methyltransferase (decarboxylating) subunit CbiE n=1 Tax=Synechocystis sp. LKSZ1 TaxID=3144951 RepID=UPI00336BC764